MTPAAVGMLAVGILAGTVFALVLSRVLKRQTERLERQIRDQFGGVEGRLKENADHFVQSANDRFMIEQTKSKAILEQNRQAIEFQVDHLNKELTALVDIIHQFEKDRAGKFVSLEEKIAQSALATRDLSETTQKLSAVIGNNQLRGQWGQRMAEDILRASGLEQGIHYLKDQSQETVSTRPDFTFLLPDQHKVYMDVKFPLNNYLAMAEADDNAEQQRYSADFIRDVKNRIRELRKREYVNAEEETLDYVILFIPNEQIFGVIHRISPGIMDEALSQKILLTSPYSLYGVLSIIRQAHDNFYFKKSTNEILKLISQFLDDYENFKKRFAELGESIDKAKDRYLEVSQKSFKKLDLRIQRLEDFRKGEARSEKALPPESGTERRFILQE